MRRLLVPLGLLSALAIIVPGTPASAAKPGPAPELLRTVTAQTETPPLFDDDAGGNADGDDPAIWLDPHNRAKSLVFGTAKDAGLRVYDLKGRELQAIRPPAAPGPDDAPGRFNNVDLVTGFELGGQLVDLAVVTDRGRDTLRFYRIDGAVATPLVDVTSPDVPLGFNTNQDEVNEQATVYGLATYRGLDGSAYAVASRRHTPTVGIFRLFAQGSTVNYERVDTLTLPSTYQLPNGQSWTPCADPDELPQVEGMTVDPTTHTLYFAQEDVALWRVQVGNGDFAGTPRQVERVKEFGIPAVFDPESEECVVDYDHDPGFGGRIAADVEGVTILRTGFLSGTLVVSSQGDDTFYTYGRLSNLPLAHFSIVDGPHADGSQECDGAAVTGERLPGYPNGLLVVHDGHNTPDVPGADGEARTSTNFKFLDAGFLR